MNRFHLPMQSPRAMRGAVLFVALVFLILITLLGLTASGTSVLEERMTGGMRSNQMSLLGAENAARGAESWLWNLSANGLKLNCGYNGGDQGFCYSSQVMSITGSPTGGTLVSNPLPAKFRRTPTWIPQATSGATSYGVTGYGTSMTAAGLGTAKLSQQPLWLMEDMGVLLPPGANTNGEGGSQTLFALRCRSSNCQTMHSYRISARSTGGTDASVHAVETYYGVGLPSN